MEAEASKKKKTKIDEQQEQQEAMVSLPDSRKEATEIREMASPRGICALVQWEWCSDGLLWTPYPPSASATIEAAFQSREPAVNLRVAHGFYNISFRPNGPLQKNVTTGRTRPVKRLVTEQGAGVSWLWWETETQKWHAYEVALTAEIERTWQECNLSKTTRNHYSPAGLIFLVHGQTYAIEFETDAMQYNVKTKFSRGVRRQSCLQNSCPLCANRGPSCSSSGVAATSNTLAEGLGRWEGKPPSLEAFTMSQRINPCYPQAGTNLLQSESDARDEILEGPSYRTAEILDYSNPSDTEDCSICLTTLQESPSVTLMKCRHSYHRECIESWFKSRPTCPECLTVYGIITGSQPPGEMHVNYITYGSKRPNSRLEGYPHTDIIQITYRLPSGIQAAEHPNPGRPYVGTVRIAYLPKNHDGEEVLELLKKAWNRRLLFRVGTSVTTGQSDVVIWAGIHHKTRTSGGSSNYGYPDETYFSRVKKELEGLGVT